MEDYSEIKFAMTQKMRSNPGLAVLENLMEGATENGAVRAEGRKVFQFPVNGASNQFLLGFLNVVMTNISSLECTKSIQLRSTISKTRKIRCDVHGVNTRNFL